MRINRIRLEFKVSLSISPSDMYSGLIESDWNLKGIHVSEMEIDRNRINRIRLEFKAIGFFSHRIQKKTD